MAIRSGHILITLSLALVVLLGCSSEGNDGTSTISSPTNDPSVAILYFHFFDDYLTVEGTIIGLEGDSSTGIHKTFRLTSTDPTDTDPTTIAENQLGVVELSECDVAWDLQLLIRNDKPDDPNYLIPAQHDMQFFSCGSEYMCRVENVIDASIGGYLICTLNP